jgi:hypothetical protein
VGLRRGQVDRRVALLPSQLPKTQLYRTGFCADIIQDRRAHPALFYCIIQHQHSKEILWLGQCSSFEEAERAAKRRLTDFSIGNKATY